MLPLVEQIAVPVHRLDLVANDMDERHLGEFKLLRSPAQSRNVDRNPCAVSSPWPIRRNSIDIAMLLGGHPILTPMKAKPRREGGIRSRRAGPALPVPYANLIIFVLLDTHDFL
jgi:hypothetical protein